MCTRSSNWMSYLKDDLLISDINIPGSHDCAAINKHSHSKWDRQDVSITEQLIRGIRLLDVRIAIMKRVLHSREISQDGHLCRNGGIAKGLFVEIRPGEYLPQQVSTTETFYDLKCSLEVQVNVAICRQLLVDTSGEALDDAAVISQFWPAEQLQFIIKLQCVDIKSDSVDESTLTPSPALDGDGEDSFTYEFLTIHGTGNYYQSFPSLMNECRDFLCTHPSEFLILNFQIDEGEVSPGALRALRGIITSSRYLVGYPIIPVDGQSNGRGGAPPLPCVGEVRGKMVLFNRVRDDYALGVPLSVWADPIHGQNQPWIEGNVACRDDFSVYVQDRFTGFGSDTRAKVEEEKFQLIKDAIDMFRRADGDGRARRCLLMNYASVSSHNEVYNTKRRLIEYFLSVRIPQHRASEKTVSECPSTTAHAMLSRIDKIGWMLFDYPFDTFAVGDRGNIEVGCGERRFSMVDILVASNFSYEDLPVRLHLSTCEAHYIRLACPPDYCLSFAPIAVAPAGAIDEVCVPPDSPQSIRVCIGDSCSDPSSAVAAFFRTRCVPSLPGAESPSPGAMVGCGTDAREPETLRFAIHGCLKVYDRHGVEVVQLDDVLLGQGPRGADTSASTTWNSWWIGGPMCLSASIRSHQDSVIIPAFRASTSSPPRAHVCFTKSPQSLCEFTVSLQEVMSLTLPHVCVRDDHVTTGDTTGATTIPDAVSPFTWRLATMDDVPKLTELMNESILELLSPFLNPEQVSASFEFMGVDSQLIEDQTYFVICENEEIVGCGGWSRRNTLCGGNHSVGRDATLLDPRTQPARVRAMYTCPKHQRRGIGRMIIKLCEEKALQCGFSSMVLLATLAGKQLYKSCGYVELCRTEVYSKSGVAVPAVKMAKDISH